MLSLSKQVAKTGLEQLYRIVTQVTFPVTFAEPQWNASQ